MTARAFEDPGVEAVFAAYPPGVRQRLLEVRQLVFETAADIDAVGLIEESLRWGEPAWLTPSKTGTTLRMDCKDPASGEFALYVNCQTDLISGFRATHGARFRYEGSRALCLDLDGDLPIDAVREFIALALTYKLRSAARRRAQRS